MSTRSARELGFADWQLARFLVCDEGLSYAEAARRLKVKPGAIRMRAGRENWFAADGGDADTGNIDDYIAQHSDRQILRVLLAMDGTLDVAAGQSDPTQLDLALRKSELIGKYARSSQSVARASSVLTQTKRRLAEAARPVASPARTRIPAPSVEETIRILNARAEKMRLARAAGGNDGRSNAGGATGEE